jgi:2-methylisocitrate lyase-like PEP mutase family enzyme
MADDKTSLKHVKLEVELPEPVIEELKRLLRTGFYGFTIEDVVGRIVCSHLRDLRQKRV